MPLIRRGKEVIVPHDRRNFAAIEDGTANPPAKKQNRTQLTLNPVFPRLLIDPMSIPRSLTIGNANPVRRRRPPALPQSVLDRLTINPAFQRFYDCIDESPTHSHR